MTTENCPHLGPIDLATNQIDAQYINQFIRLNKEVRLRDDRMVIPVPLTLLLQSRRLILLMLIQGFPRFELHIIALMQA